MEIVLERGESLEVSFHEAEENFIIFQNMDSGEVEIRQIAGFELRPGEEDILEYLELYKGELVEG